MSGILAKLFRVLIVVSLVGLMALPAFAAIKVQVTAVLADTCMNCSTDIADPDPIDLNMKSYSVLSDGLPYDNTTVKSGILTNTSVYTLDTTGTLVNGLVGPGTRTVRMHFFSSVEGIYSNNVLPGCWSGPDTHDQDQAANWSVFANNSASFPKMQLGVPYPGFARLDFSVRPNCDTQIYRYYVKWYNVCIVHKDNNTWEVTSDSCGRQTNYGEANLRGQGGKSGQTIDYGDWRLPFKMTLTQ